MNATCLLPALYTPEKQATKAVEAKDSSSKQDSTISDSKFEGEIQSQGGVSPTVSEGSASTCMPTTSEAIVGDGGLAAGSAAAERRVVCEFGSFADGASANKGGTDDAIPMVTETADESIEATREADNKESMDVQGVNDAQSGGQPEEGCEKDQDDDAEDFIAEACNGHLRCSHAGEEHRDTCNQATEMDALVMEAEYQTVARSEKDAAGGEGDVADGEREAADGEGDAAGGWGVAAVDEGKERLDSLQSRVAELDHPSLGSECNPESHETISSVPASLDSQRTQSSSFSSSEEGKDLPVPGDVTMRISFSQQPPIEPESSESLHSAQDPAPLPDASCDLDCSSADPVGQEASAVWGDDDDDDFDEAFLASMEAC